MPRDFVAPLHQQLAGDGWEGRMIISAHAIQRYQERVANVSDADARKAMDTPAVNLAIRFGAPYVRLGTGQRLAIEDGVIVTVLPGDIARGKLDPKRRAQ